MNTNYCHTQEKLVIKWLWISLRYNLKNLKRTENNRDQTKPQGN